MTLHRHLLPLALVSLSLGAMAPAADWTATKGAPVAGAPDVEQTTWTSGRPPGGPFDRIEVHRYRAKAVPVASVLYLPGTNMNGEVAVADEDHNLWIFLAKNGVEVFALDYRTRFASSSTDPAALASKPGRRHATNTVAVLAAITATRLLVIEDAPAQGVSCGAAGLG